MKILMLHGHGQSGNMFYFKTKKMDRAIRNLASASFHLSLPQKIELMYLDGPLPTSASSEADTWAWGYGDPERDMIRGLDTTINLIMDTLTKDGPFVGIVGFSTGAAIAAIIAAILEQPERCQIFQTRAKHPPLRFVVCYCGFKLGHFNYDALYRPQILTPMIHFVAEWDTVIPKEWTEELINHCAIKEVYHFKGTHYVPQGLSETKAASEFIGRCLGWSDDTGNHPHEGNI